MLPWPEKCDPPSQARVSAGVLWREGWWPQSEDRDPEVNDRALAKDPQGCRSSSARAVLPGVFRLVHLLLA